MYSDVYMYKNSTPIFASGSFKIVEKTPRLCVLQVFLYFFLSCVIPAGDCRNSRHVVLTRKGMRQKAPDQLCIGLIGCLLFRLCVVGIEL